MSKDIGIDARISAGVTDFSIQIKEKINKRDTKNNILIDGTNRVPNRNKKVIQVKKASSFLSVPDILFVNFDFLSSWKKLTKKTLRSLSITKVKDFIPTLNLIEWPLLIFYAIIPKQELQNFESENIVVTAVNSKRIIAYLCMISSLRFVSKTNLYFVPIIDKTVGVIGKVTLRWWNLPYIFVDYKDWQELKYLALPTLFPNKQILLIDSDILFFNEPKEILNTKNIFYMQDMMSRYSLSSLEVNQLLNENLLPKVNVGLLRINTKDIDKKLFSKVQSALSLVDEWRNVESFFIEQTVYAILLKRLSLTKNVVKLSDLYFLLPRKTFFDHPIPKDIVCIHYTNLHESKRIFDSYSLLVKTFIAKIKTTYGI